MEISRNIILDLLPLYIADEASAEDVQVRRLRVEARKWVAARLLPRWRRWPPSGP